MSASSKPDASLRPSNNLTEVKYSLPEMLEELKAERATSSFGMERLDQHEIGKLFKAKQPRRRAKSKS
jgi:hypothetical protein